MNRVEEIRNEISRLTDELHEIAEERGEIKVGFYGILIESDGDEIEGDARVGSFRAGNPMLTGIALGQDENFTDLMESMMISKLFVGVDRHDTEQEKE